MDKPNERHERFCREYVRRPVGNAAALAAGYSEANAAAQACRLLARPDIQLRIAELRDAVAEQQCGDVSAVLARLQVIYERVIEHNQFNTALRAVAMQLRVKKYSRNAKLVIMLTKKRINLAHIWSISLAEQLALLTGSNIRKRWPDQVWFGMRQLWPASLPSQKHI